MTAIKNTRMPKFNLKSSFWLEGEPSWTIPPTKFSKWKPNFIMSKKSSWLLPQSLVYYYRRITEFNKVKRFNPAFHPNHVQEPPHQSTGRDILVVFSVGSRDVCQYSIVYRPGLGTDCWRNDDRIIVFTYFGRWRGSPEIDWDLKLPQNVEITTTSHQDKLWLHSYQHSVVSTATYWSTRAVNWRNLNKVIVGIVDYYLDIRYHYLDEGIGWKKPTVSFILSWGAITSILSHIKVEIPPIMCLLIPLLMWLYPVKCVWVLC